MWAFDFGRGVGGVGIADSGSRGGGGLERLGVRKSGRSSKESSVFFKSQG